MTLVRSYAGQVSGLSNLKLSDANLTLNKKLIKCRNLKDFVVSQSFLSVEIGVCYKILKKFAKLFLK